MIFGPISIKEYGEPIAAHQLEIGKVYFLVQFHDDAMKIPLLEPLVFIGNDLGNAGEGESYFQDFPSYDSGLRIGHVNAEELCIQTFPTENLGSVYEYDKALDVLIGCWARRVA